MSENGTKTILITGCTSGIGYETSRYLHEMGYQLVLTGRNENKLKDISEKLKCDTFYICDLNKPEEIDHIFEYLKKKDIRLDGMVHSAGCGGNTPVKLFKDENMQRIMDLNYYSFMRLSRNFCQRKYSNTGASIVALSSFATVTYRKGSALYSASKAALNAAVLTMAKEFVKRETRVNAIMPAYVDTRMNEGLDDLIEIGERQPFGLIEPRQIAYLIEFLLSGKSKYITGALIPVSAGMEGC